MSRFRKHRPSRTLLAMLAVLLPGLMSSACDRREERVERLQSIADGVTDQVSGQEPARKDKDNERN